MRWVTMTGLTGLGRLALACAGGEADAPYDDEPPADDTAVDLPEEGLEWRHPLVRRASGRRHYPENLAGPPGHTGVMVNAGHDASIWQIQGCEDAYVVSVPPVVAPARGSALGSVCPPGRPRRNRRLNGTLGGGELGDCPP